MKNSISTKKLLYEVTNGVAKTATNGVLWWLYVMGASIGKSHTSRGAYEMFREADDALRDCNYDHFRCALIRLQQQRLIAKRRKRTTIEVSITELGKKRLSEFIPSYKTIRPWDGYVYLISYDIPEASKRVRDQFRQYLVAIGCAKLQASVWITPYTPRDLVNDFAEEHSVEGTILVSKLDKNGLIGDETLAEVIVRIYNLEKLQERYEEFLLRAKTKKMSFFQKIVLYKSILGDDPQLPFELLPSWWNGDKAYEWFCSLRTK